MNYIVTINGKKYEVQVEKALTGASAKAPNAKTTGNKPSISQPKASENLAGESKVTAPMPGTVLEVKVSEGQSVQKGDVLLILEAMKMENEIVSEAAGVVKKLEVAKGSKVVNGDTLVVIG